MAPQAPSYYLVYEKTRDGHTRQVASAKSRSAAKKWMRDYSSNLQKHYADEGITEEIPFLFISEITARE